ncbi:MAG: hypothetical protein RXR20_21875 [Paraburkholderia sp.]|uniref:hypothetical protein n=1 Tax=Burkholderiaceae TaxID=119060 RepID=UPI0010F4361D|nr:MULTISPECIES: hypothetical protein [Burkholderiaceae]
MTSEELQVASKDVIVGDAIRLATVHSGSACGRLANVVGVTVIGVNVKIDTDLGVTEFLPVNRSITVWR